MDAAEEEKILDGTVEELMPLLTKVRETIESRTGTKIEIAIVLAGNYKTVIAGTNTGLAHACRAGISSWHRGDMAKRAKAGDN